MEILNTEVSEYPVCNSKEFKKDFSELCDACPLKRKIRDGIETQIALQAKEKKEVLPINLFKKYIENEIENASETMDKVFQFELQNKEYIDDPFRGNRIEMYIWNKERIKKLKDFLKKMNEFETHTHKLFLSYSHQDEELKNKLATHLAPLRRSGKVAVWQDRQILPGTEWDAAIKQELAEADIILLLVSADFIASEYIWKYEIAGAMERHERREATVIPIIVRPCEWHDMPFAKVQSLPRNAKPVTTYANQDEAWLEVVQGIKRVVEV